MTRKDIGVWFFSVVLMFVRLAGRLDGMTHTNTRAHGHCFATDHDCLSGLLVSEGTTNISDFDRAYEAHTDSVWCTPFIII